MLKKVAHISLIALLLFSTIGVTTYKHYCGNTLMAKSIGIKPDNCCGADCKDCHNESIQYKITDNFEAQNVKISFESEITRLFDNANFATLLFVAIFENKITPNLFYKLKNCEKLLSTQENSSAFLQVFRI